VSPTSLTEPLDGLTSAGESSFGGKSAHLGELLRAGIPVPPGFALSTAAFEAFIEEQGLRGAIEAALAGARDGGLDTLRAASAGIADAMRAGALPVSVQEEIALRYDELAAQTILTAPAVAVRSSAVGEDSLEATFAGQQETYLWISGLEEICVAVRDCWASLYSAEAISYRARLGGNERPAMGVTVQLMVDAAVSGVLFTCNPVSGDPSMVAVNASWGLGQAVVSGEVTPDDFLVSKVTGEVVRRNLGSKDIRYVRAVGGGTTREDVPPALRDAPCVDDRELTALVEIARRVERHFGRHQDVEWAIARGSSTPEGLFILQSRPVTTVHERPRDRAPLSAMALLMGTFGAGDPPDAHG
jgi:pyruvate,water dikinase